jgi:GTP-binding protein HflX
VQQLTGNLQGLSPADKAQLERIWRRRVSPSQLVSPELATFLCECSASTGRQVGVLLDRRGLVEHVIVGDHQKLFLPELGPRRAGVARFRGVRLVHTHLRGEPLSHDDLMDLAKLRLDAVAAIQMRPDGQLGPITVAHLLPANPAAEQWRVLPPVSAHELQRGRAGDFAQFIQSLEEEFQRKAEEARVVDDGRDRALLCMVQLGRMTEEEATAREGELRELARTAGLRILDVVRQRRHEPDPRWLVGKGKIEEIVLRALQADATLLVFDHDLTPAQARTISDATELKVLDRTMLILDIFAQHAHSRDGKLQVELAQLKYTLPRLQEKNTMMSRLTGGPRAGVGGRGPGETRLEINRRRARERIHRLEEEIAELGKRRAGRRQLRHKGRLPVVSIVGYTNAGKSTLLNSLTSSDVLVENKLFATLDPTSRRLRFPDEREIIITDTVGFIRDLPKDLVAAFRATLEELEEADLLLHVIDGADPAYEVQMRAVETILGELSLGDKPRLLVFNKRDLVSYEQSEQLKSGFLDPQGGRPLVVSARVQATLTALEERIVEALWREDKLIDGAPEPSSWEGSAFGVDEVAPGEGVRGDVAPGEGVPGEGVPGEGARREAPPDEPTPMGQ